MHSYYHTTGCRQNGGGHGTSKLGSSTKQNYEPPLMWNATLEIENRGSTPAVPTRDRRSTSTAEVTASDGRLTGE